jgi:hypothetical protein
VKILNMKIWERGSFVTSCFKVKVVWSFEST